MSRPASLRAFAGNLAWLLYRAHWALAAELSAALKPLGVSRAVLSNATSPGLRDRLLSPPISTRETPSKSVTDLAVALSATA